MKYIIWTKDYAEFIKWALYWGLWEFDLYPAFRFMEKEEIESALFGTWWDGK
jgi:hypothetical protein